MRGVLKIAAVALGLAITPAIVTAGSSSAANPVLPVAQVTSFANQVEKDLAARGARVAIVARTGRDPSVLPAGVNYTHLAFWVFSDITYADGRRGQGYRVYNLYQRSGDLSASDLVQDSPADFFAAAYRLDAGVIVPAPTLQDKLLRVIQSPTYAALHNPRYAVLANPADTRFQNCTEHVLNVLMASLYDTSDSARIKANIAAHFEPQTIPVDGLQRALGGTVSAALTTADHGAVVKTATFGSVARFMEKHRLTQRIYRMTPQGASRF